ncbi:hypothetical protein LguiB_031331 [Lonicera macranthoides]
MQGFSSGKGSGARVAALFSLSEPEFRNLKLIFGRKRFMDDDLLLEGPGDSHTLASEGLGVNRKFTFFGVGGILI